MSTTFRIKVKPFKGQDYMVDVEPETTVLELKRRIVATGPMRDVDPSRLRLIVLGRVLADDSSTLASQHVTEGTVVHMIVRDPEVPQPAEQQAPRPQPSAEMPRSNSTPFEDGAIPPIPGGAFGGIDVGGLFRGIMQQVGTAAAVINAQRSAAAPAAPAAPPSEPAAAPAPPTAAATAPTPPLGGLPPGVAFQHVQLGPGLAHGMPPPPFLIPQPSPLAAVHVHLHVTLAELESVPEQVQRLQQRLAANAAPNITQIHIQTHNVNVDPATAAATAARNPNPATSRPQAPPSRPTLDSVARPTGELAGTSILTVLQKALETAGTPDAMMLMSGNWAVANRIRDPLRAYAATRTANQVGNAELREELVEEATIDAMVKLDGNADIQRELRARVRDGVDGRRLIQGVVRITLRDLLDLVVDGNSADIGPQVRRLAVKTVGLAMSYFERNVARNGASDLDAIVNATINAVMTEALRSRPDVAPLAGMFAPMLGGTMREWRHEYESSLRTPNDATRLEAAAAAVVPVSTRPAAAATGNRPAPAAVAAAATTPAPPRASSDLDELLDACLDETAPAAAAPPAPTAAAPPSRLQRLFESSTALDPESARSLAAMVAEDLRAGTAGLVPPPDHYFDAYRSNSLF